ATARSSQPRSRSTPTGLASLGRRSRSDPSWALRTAFQTPKRTSLAVSSRHSRSSPPMSRKRYGRPCRLVTTTSAAPPTSGTSRQSRCAVRSTGLRRKLHFDAERPPPERADAERHGQPVRVAADPTATLLEILRDELGL